MSKKKTARPLLVKSRFFEPYTGTKTNLLFAKNLSGVYLIKNGSSIVYIGYSETNIYKTCLRHFQQWPDKSQVRVFYTDLSRITVRIVLCTPARAARLERALILQHEPADNPDKLKKHKASAAELNILQEYQGTTPTSYADLNPDFVEF